MRWRFARGVQRRIPAPEAIVSLDGDYAIPKNQQNQIVGLTADPATLTAFTSGVQVFVNPSADTSAAVAAAPPSWLAPLKGLEALDDWLAANDNQPDVTALNAEIAALLGAYLPKTAAWKLLRVQLLAFFYQALILSALATPPGGMTDTLGKLTRLILVMALVDTLQQNPSPIQTPDQVYVALRWRTLVLPQWVVDKLLAIRAARKAILVRKPGFADLYITREEWDHYEAAEIASIENILAGEVKSRVHVLVNQTSVTTTKEEVTSSLREQDTTTTDLTQLQEQSSSDISLAAHADLQVDVSGSYGTVQFGTHLGGSVDFSSASSTSKATTQSHETVARAVSRIEQTTRLVRTVSTMTRATDKEEHKFDNAQQTQPVVGLYRWVDQIQNVELDRYPHRLIMEFEIPEPGAYTRRLQLNSAGRNMVHKPPVPLTLDGNPISYDPKTVNPPLQASDLDPTNYSAVLKIASRYMTGGVSPPPGPQTVAVNIGYPTTASTGVNPDGGAHGDFRYQADSSLSVPSGYYAHDWDASVILMTGGSTAFPSYNVFIAVGAGSPAHSPSGAANINPTTNWMTDAIQAQQVGPISIGTIPVAVQVDNSTGFEVNVEVHCVPLDQTLKQWQDDTYDLIVGAYNGMLQAYNDELAGAGLQQTNLVDANSPDQNAQTARQELKRQVIEMLSGTSFTGIPNAISWNSKGTGPDYPTTSLDTAAAVAPEIQFFEQALEWETMSYICYPYYWADSSRWPDLEVIAGNDNDFANFLRAGSARVMVAARPGFEDQVNPYTRLGILWGGGPMPAPGDPDYLSVADEIKAMQQRPMDAAVIDTWQVRLPTTLIWLQNAAGLPSNPNPTIDTKPKIASLSPTSASVGASMNITGRNFGDFEGTSTVTFNGTEAIPTRWGATSIDVQVPTGATTGNVVVTINSVGSNPVPFTVL